jgi:3-oxoacyl-(acyl-carrier-protein) synthase
MNSRVVITGLGVAAPNGVGLDQFRTAIQLGTSGVRFIPELERLKFSCQIAGQPIVSEEKKRAYLSELQLRNFNSSGILYGVMSGLDAWRDAGLEPADDVDFDSGIIFGTGTSGIDKFRESIYKVDDLKVRRLGSTVVAQIMASGISAYLGGILGLGNQVSTNSSACITGAEAILMGFDRIRAGRAKRMLVGSCSDHGPYLWGGFDAMRVLTYKHNNEPEKGSRPMSHTASGFVPGSGGGALLLEDLQTALDRGATIYAELLGGEVNSGGHRNGGTMTAPNSTAVQRCITKALENTGVHASEIDTINGHLTATIKDPTEIENWTKALQLKGDDFPPINTLKSTIGHCLAAGASIEAVASVLQVKEDFIFPNVNCEDIHPDISQLISTDAIPQRMVKKEINILAKASFGFGDVNACLLFKKFKA